MVALSDEISEQSLDDLLLRVFVLTCEPCDCTFVHVHDAEPVRQYSRDAHQDLFDFIWRHGREETALPGETVDNLIDWQLPHILRLEETVYLHRYDDFFARVA